MVHKLANRIKMLAPILLALSWHANLYAQQPAITTAARVHDLPADQAAKKIPVHLTATVTYYEPSERTLFVADASGAVYVKTTRFYPIHRGDLVKIDGFTAMSFRTTVAPDPHIPRDQHQPARIRRRRRGWFPGTRQGYSGWSLRQPGRGRVDDRISGVRWCRVCDRPGDRRRRRLVGRVGHFDRDRRIAALLVMTGKPDNPPFARLAWGSSIAVGSP